MLDVNGRTLEVDSRPSDAIALAVRVDAPIFAEESVLDRAGVILDENDESEERSAPARPLEETKPADPEELEKLGVFKEFIEGLDLDDFDKR